MQRSTARPSNAALAVAALALAALLALTVAPAAAQSSDDAKVEKIHKIVKTRVHCDGEDCPETHAIFVDEDGNVQKLGAGHPMWTGEEGGPGHLMRMFPGALGGGFLGVGLTELTPELRTHFGVPEDAGVMVSKVVDDSPAQRAGIAVGDIITLVDDETVASGGELARRISAREDGETVALEVWRDGRARRLSATLEKREGLRMAMGPRFHMLHGDGPMRHVEVLCEDGDCTSGPGALTDFDCDGAEECEVRVVCKDGGCTCTVNGEDADCAEIGVDGE